MKTLIKLIRWILDLVYYGKFKEEDQNWYNGDLEVIDKDELPDNVVDQLRKEIKQHKIPKKDIKLHSPTEQVVPYVTSDWGTRPGYRNGKKKKVFHYGIDLYAPCGQEGKPTQNQGFAIEDGIVIAIETHNPKHPTNFKRDPKRPGEWIYLNVNSPTSLVKYKGYKTGFMYYQKHTLNAVKVGDSVYKGQKICKYGNYGWSRLSHCHLELHIYSKVMGRYVPKNPRKVLKKYGLNFTGRIKNN